MPGRMRMYAVFAGAVMLFTVSVVQNPTVTAAVVSNGPAMTVEDELRK
jgi:hypothetical protein